jgi:hypothetical protein
VRCLLLLALLRSQHSLPRQLAAIDIRSPTIAAVLEGTRSISEFSLDFSGLLPSKSSSYFPRLFVPGSIAVCGRPILFRHN